MVHEANRGGARARSLDRDRLTAEADRVWEHRLTLVTAPAGAGKTTLLHQLADRAGAPVAWCTTEPGDASSADLLLRVEMATTAAFDGLIGHWSDVDDAAAALADWRGRRGLLVVDDLHVIDGTPAETSFGHLVEALPDHVRVLVASRCVPRTNLSRLRVKGELLEIDADALRFRSWEVEHLFDRVYGERLAPADAALLTRRTGGWAAGLQLFHLASSGNSADDRRRLLSQVATRSRHVRDYLAENVLSHLPDELRAFLLDTFSLGDHLVPAWCDELAGRPGSAAVLEELARRQVFTTEVDSLGTYRYHEVLRSHLEDVVRQAQGEDGVQRRHRAAAELLEREGAIVEALVAYTRGGCWDEVTRVAGERGGSLDTGDGWLDALPRGLVEHDPWLLLARARRSVADGAFDAALAGYEAASAALGPGTAGDVCRAERTLLRAWTAGASRSRSWVAVARAAVGGRPGEHTVSDPGGWQDHAINALVSWLRGTSGPGDPSVEALLSDPWTPAGIRVAAHLLSGPGRLLTVDPVPLDRAGTEHLRAVVERAEATGIPWLARTARSLLSLTSPEDRTAAALARESDRLGDAWGAALSHLVAGVAALAWGHPSEGELALAAQRLRDLGAGSLAAWADAYAALERCRAQDPDGADAAGRAARAARAAGVPGAQEVAARATQVPSAPVEPVEPAPIVSITCMGGLEVRCGTDTVDLSGIKPRARSVLRLLACRAPAFVHLEAIIDALWPDVDPVAARRSLQVAISSLRTVLDPLLPAGSPSAVSRLDDAYRLAVGPTLTLDLLELGTALTSGKAALASGDRVGAAEHLTRVLALGRGELFPMEGPAEWVLGERDRLRRRTAAAALDLAELLVADGDLRGAVDVCEEGLVLDPLDDALWRTLIAVQERRGARAAAARARARYALLLDELGIDATLVIS